MKQGDLEKTEKEVIASREHALKVGRRRSTLKPDVPGSSVRLDGARNICSEHML